MNNRLELTILMPCLNEARTVVACVEEALGFLRRAGVSGEVLVADNGSTDGSIAQAEAAGARVIAVAERGYGAALQAGIAAAHGHFVIMGDSDQSYNFGALDGYLERLRSGADLVMGNRFAGTIHPGAMPPLHRYLGNPVLSFIGRLFFRVPVGDFHCGLRGFRRDKLQALRLVCPGMEFASEMVAKAALAGLRIEEVPTELRPDGRGRPPHLRTWRDGWRHLRFLLLFCPRWLFLYPGLVLFMLGLVGLVTLSQGPLRFGSMGLDVHSMLYMSGFALLGAQLIQFAVLIRWLGALSGVSPPQRWISWIAGGVSVEGGLVISGLMMASGVIWSILLLSAWGQGGFGALDPGQSMRSVIPAVTLVLMGGQGFAWTFFAGAVHAVVGHPKR